MSRICVKSLSKNTNDKQLNELFSKCGEITDLRLMKTSKGISRRFAFIGYRTEAEAEKAIKYFNNTYLSTSKIQVEIAVNINNNEVINKSFSKYTKSKISSNKSVDNSKILKEEPVNKSKSKSDIANDKDFNEFKQVMQSRRKTNTWGNDDAVNETDQQSVSIDRSNNLTDRSSEVSVDDDENPSDMEEIIEESVDLTNMTDLDYLKSKMKKKTSPIKSNNNSSDNNLINENQLNDDNPNDKDESDNEINDNGRLFIRNLPFTVTEEELKQILQSYGLITEVHIPIDDNKKGKGYAFIQYMIPENAITAKSSLDGTFFQGRLLHIISAKNPRENISSKDTDNKLKLSSYKLKKDLERKQMLFKRDNWNSSFVRSDTVVESMADRYNIKKSDIFDPNEGASEAAIRLSIAETQIINENKEYLTSKGVDISTLESYYSVNKQNIQRSNNTILIKNLPYDTNDDELEQMFTRFGPVLSFIITKSKTIALVEFIESNDAKLAYKSLAYRNYHKVPLYLEWAPVNIINKSKVVKLDSKLLDDQTDNKEIDKVDDKIDQIEVVDNHEYSTIYIKNLSFNTTEEILYKFIKDLNIQGVRTISIQKKQKSSTEKSMISLGYGFIEFVNSTNASIGLNRINKLMIDNHCIEAKPSDKRISKQSTSTVIKDTKEKSNKLVVRNIPFQATVKDIKGLFSAFGTIKSVRIPKKMNHNHRGFAFLEFSTINEATNALANLSNSHLYGRHLVIEYAKDEDDNNVDILRKRSSMQEKIISNESKRKKLDDYIGIDSGFKSNSDNNKVSISNVNDDDDDDELEDNK